MLPNAAGVRIPTVLLPIYVPWLGDETKLPLVRFIVAVAEAVVGTLISEGSRNVHYGTQVHDELRRGLEYPGIISDSAIRRNGPTALGPPVRLNLPTPHFRAVSVMRCGGKLRAGEGQRQRDGC